MNKLMLLAAMLVSGFASAADQPVKPADNAMEPKPAAAAPAKMEKKPAAKKMKKGKKKAAMPVAPKP